MSTDIPKIFIESLGTYCPVLDVTKQNSIDNVNDWASVSSDIFLQLESAICYALFTAGDKFIFMTVLFSQEKVNLSHRNFPIFYSSSPINNFIGDL